jgi:hypothetical protein
VAQPDTARLTGAAATPGSVYLLAGYLERLGVDVIFACGHTNIAFLDAIGKNRILRDHAARRSPRMPPTATRERRGSRASC